MSSRAPLFILGLLAINAFVWHAVLTPRTLAVSVLNIGQGDSILVRGPTGVLMLVDGGPDASVLRELGAVLPFGMRRIDAVVETHPDKDHISGLLDVFARYDVANFLEPAIHDRTNAAAALAAAASAEPNVRHIVARRGMRLNLGGGAYADILHPDRDVSTAETNAGSVTMRVVYGKTSFMLTGDLPIPVEEWLVRLDANDGELPTTVLKAGHHGSKFSTGDDWLSALRPETVAISVGAHNTYGHPTVEMLSRVAREGATVYRTDRDGRITFFSDGVTVRKR